MARISVEQKALTDSRFSYLAILLIGQQVQGQIPALTEIGVGIMVRVWNECQERETDRFHFVMLDCLGKSMGFQGTDATDSSLSSAILQADLGERVEEHHIRIKGAAERCGWLKEAREIGRKNGSLGASHGSKGGRPKNPPMGVSENGVEGLAGNPPPTPTPALTPTQNSEKTTTLVRPPSRSDAVRAALASPTRPSPLNGTGRDEAMLENFATLYGFYPRHVGKAAAWRAFSALKPDADTLHAIVVDVKRRTDAGEWLPNDPERVRFIPHLSSYLNQRRWTDE